MVAVKVVVSLPPPGSKVPPPLPEPPRLHMGFSSGMIAPDWSLPTAVNSICSPTAMVTSIGETSMVVNWDPTGKGQRMIPAWKTVVGALVAGIWAQAMMTMFEVLAMLTGSNLIREVTSSQPAPVRVMSVSVAGCMRTLVEYLWRSGCSSRVAAV